MSGDGEEVEGMKTSDSAQQFLSSTEVHAQIAPPSFLGLR
jgi:hypothetical protein